MTVYSLHTLTGIGLSLNNMPLDYPSRDDPEFSDIGPHVAGAHLGMDEAHVFEDNMQLVDLAREGIPTVATAQHARHVIEIIEAAYRAAETGQTQTLSTTFTPQAGA